MRALLIVAAVGMACRPAPRSTPFTLRIAVSGPLDPVIPSAELRSWASFVVPIVFQPPILIGQEGDIAPVLVSRVESAGAKDLRIWPRTDARFSDGSPVTLEELGQSLAANRLSAVREGESLLVTSDDASIPVELQLSRAFVFRRAGGAVIGTGAFAVEEQDATHIILARVKPAPGFIARVRMDSYSTPQDAFAHTLKGDADMLPEVQPRWIEFFEGVPRLRVLRAPGPTANMVAFNPKRLTQAERLALAGVVTSDEVRRLAFDDECSPPTQRPEIEPLHPGRPLDVMAVPFLDRFAFSVRRSLGNRGGTVRVAELQEFVKLLNAGDFDLATIRPRIWPPIMAAISWRSGSAGNLFHYSNPAVDAALDRRDWIAARRELARDPPAAIVCVQPAMVVLDARIKNASLTASFKESLPQWEVAQ